MFQNGNIRYAPELRRPNEFTPVGAWQSKEMRLYYLTEHLCWKVWSGSKLLTSTGKVRISSRRPQMELSPQSLWRWRGPYISGESTEVSLNFRYLTKHFWQHKTTRNRWLFRVSFYKPALRHPLKWWKLKNGPQATKSSDMETGAQELSFK